MKLKIYSLLIFASIILYSCGTSGSKDSHSGHNHADHSSSTVDHTDHNHSEHDHDHDHGDEHTEASHKVHDHGHESHSPSASAAANHNEIVIEPSQSKELGFEYVTVSAKPFTSTIKTSGVIESTPGDDASIVATTSGIVDFSGRKLVEGSAISNGATLLRISSTTLSDDNLSTRIADAQSNLQKAKADLSRIELLYREKLTTAQAVENARLAESIASHALESLTRNTSNGCKSIISPLSGYLTSLNVRDGDFVEQGKTIATVSSNRTVVLRADLTARHFDKLNNITSANFSTPYNEQTYDIGTMNGRKLATSRSAHNYSIPVRFEIDNTKGFVSGSVVEVFLKTSTRDGVISVPRTALTEEQGAYYVYIKLDDECYTKRNVRLGESNGIDIEITHGLTPGEVVVSRGAYFVRLASMSGAIPDGHQH